MMQQGGDSVTRTETINPQILAWARETAGLSAEDAAEKLGITASTRISLADKLGATGSSGVSAADKLLSIERGEKFPTYAQLAKAASVYQRPLVTFYLAEPPSRGDRGEDFRTSPASVTKRENGLLDALIRDIRARQQMLREVLEDEDEARPLHFVASAGIKNGPKPVAASIREVLGVTEAAQKSARNPDALFNLLRAAAERAGVFVLLLGDLGSHHTAISDAVFRGFAIADEIAPFVVINRLDAKPARSFTLIHELAHVWLGAGGVSGPVRAVPGSNIERFCNDVAGEFLLPSAAFSGVSGLMGSSTEVAIAATERLAADWNVSQGAVTYRLMSLGWIDTSTAANLFQMFRQRWLRQKEKHRDNRDDDEAGPSYYVVRRAWLGPALLEIVRRNLRGDSLSHTRAAKILGVSPSSVEPLLREQPRAS